MPEGTFIRQSPSSLSLTAKMLVSSLLAVTCLLFFENPPQLLELLSHFVPQYLGASILLAFVCLPTRSWGWVTLAFVAVGLHGHALLPFVPEGLQAFRKGEERSGSSARPLSLLTANVNQANQQHDSLREKVRSLDPDIVLFLEVTPRWGKELEHLSDTYPHQHLVLQNGFFGQALYSKIPIIRTETYYPGGVEIPMIEVEFESPSGPWVFFGCHPPRPDTSFELRNQHFAKLSERVRALKRATVAAGDFNSSPWSPCFRALLKNSGLWDTRQGFGLISTWPSPLEHFGIPLDYILVDKQWETLVAARVDLPGSDHDGIMTRLLRVENR